MTKLYNNFIGIDIGKYEFVLNIHGSKKTYTYSNDAEGFSKLSAELSKQLKSSLVVLEVTGGYERALISYLQQLEIDVHRANGRQVKSFIRSYGIIAKNDNIDAIALSLYAKERQHNLEVYKPNKYDMLRELHERRQDLVNMRTQEKNRRQAPVISHLLKDSYLVIIAVLDQQIKMVEEQMDDIINSSPELKEKIRVLQTVPGIGKITAYALIAQMPELGSMNQKEAASLAGLAPHPNQSGMKTGYAKTRGGRRYIRVCLYLPALAASKTSSVLGDFYRRLRENNNKPAKCALVAVMRKMVVIANARLKIAMQSFSIA